ncbi:hypothetical protein HPC49_00885 [Pyxidicoccus fallax]|uniref:Uncharacterized protein n=1 Tax=Pyxidicoccus fallax TaxID=394095 RepID=A0A848LTN2_9BACT|nr:hypothetical protein [Pyxidicoccus fallax]NMO21348.1 hypothetical protein [Pyxidicoccus fallax]NPC76808.1 hypothetical protein [Pyxidicoccus fallax]
MVRLLRLLPLLLLSACVTTLRGRADELARKGQYVEAAALYDDLVRKSPYEQELVTTRDDLRWKALEQLLGNARRFRLEGQDENAEEDLLRFLNHRVEWNSKLNGALESSLLEEMGGTHQHLRQIIGAPAQQGLALTAEHALGRKRPLLAHREMAVIQREMENAVLQSGKDTCQRLRNASSEDAPHWRELVFRYCTRWREFAPQPPPPPELLGPPDFSGDVEGFDSAQLELLRGRLARAFKASPWFSPSATSRPEFSLAGTFSTRKDSQNVQLTAPYTEKVPYTDHEDRTETIEEPYTDVEEYTDSKGEKKTRTVEKVRKYTRTFTVAVTKYRDVARTFEYHALRLSVDHRLALSSTGVLDARRGPITAVLQDQFGESGYEHDVTFYDADVRPKRVRFTPPHGWVEQQVEAMGAAFSKRLVDHWRESYCSTPALTLDDAARCARAGTTLPTPAYRVLSEVLGDDAARVPSLFAGVGQ